MHARADGAEPLGQSVAPVACATDASSSVRRHAGDVFETSAAANDEALCARLPITVGAILAAATFADELDALSARDRNALARHRTARSPVAEARRALRGGRRGVSAVQEKSTTQRHRVWRAAARRRIGAAWRPVLVRDPLAMTTTATAGREYLEPYRREDGAPLCLLCMSAAALDGGARTARVGDTLNPPPAEGEEAASTRAAETQTRLNSSCRTGTPRPRAPPPRSRRARRRRRAEAAARAAAAAAESDARRARRRRRRAERRAERLAPDPDRAGGFTHETPTKRLDEARKRADRFAGASKMPAASTSVRGIFAAGRAKVDAVVGAVARAPPAAFRVGL